MDLDLRLKSPIEFRGAMSRHMSRSTC